MQRLQEHKIMNSIVDYTLHMDCNSSFIIDKKNFFFPLHIYKKSLNNNIKKKFLFFFSGQLHSSRIKTLLLIKKIFSKKKVMISNRRHKYSDYLSNLKKSFFTINFTTARSINKDTIFNTRLLESINNNVLVFSKKSKEIDCFFEPNKHYITYNNFYDLIKKINYYNNNLTKVKKIHSESNLRLHSIFNEIRIKKFIIKNENNRNNRFLFASYIIVYIHEKKILSKIYNNKTSIIKFVKKKILFNNLVLINFIKKIIIKLR